MGDVEMKDNRVEEVKEKLRAVIDFNNTDQLRTQIRKLADSIGLQNIDHPDPRILLQAILTYVDSALNNQLSPEEIDNQQKIDLAEMKLGLRTESENAKFNDSLKVLRLLNIEQLRRLQTQINILTVAVQKITADPKTDVNLGKVGR